MSAGMREEDNSHRRPSFSSHSCFSKAQSQEISILLRCILLSFPCWHLDTLLSVLLVAVVSFPSLVDSSGQQVVLIEVVWEKLAATGSAWSRDVRDLD